MITPVSLLEELKTFIEQIVDNYMLETNQQGKKPPQVIIGFLPPKNLSNIPDFPCIILRLVEGKDDEESATVTVKIIIGTYCEDTKEGWREPLNLIQRIWYELYKRRIIAKRYRVEYPMKFEIPEEQPYPYWIGVMTTVWTVAHPVLEEEFLYGENQ